MLLEERDAAATVRRAATSYRQPPNLQSGHNAVAAIPQGIASRLERYPLGGGRDKPAVAQEANIRAVRIEEDHGPDAWGRHRPPSR